MAETAIFGAELGFDLMNKTFTEPSRNLHRTFTWVTCLWINVTFVKVGEGWKGQTFTL